MRQNRGCWPGSPSLAGSFLKPRQHTRQAHSSRLIVRHGPLDHCLAACQELQARLVTLNPSAGQRLFVSQAALGLGGHRHQCSVNTVAVGLMNAVRFGVHKATELLDQRLGAPHRILMQRESRLHIGPEKFKSAHLKNAI